ncbi:conserved hypothetical protein [Stutzerimonas xanthomarina]|nr:conserved hypothetical protein [Stutzerimonas xanthomarina]
MNPQRFIGLGGWRRHGSPGMLGGLRLDRIVDGSCQWLRWVQLIAQQMMGGVEDFHAGAATHCAAGRAQLAAGDAKAGAAVGALGDEAGHASFRAKVPASLAYASRAAAGAAAPVVQVCGRGRKALLRHVGRR